MYVLTKTVLTGSRGTIHPLSLQRGGILVFVLRMHRLTFAGLVVGRGNVRKRLVSQLEPLIKDHGMCRLDTLLYIWNYDITVDT